MLIENNKCMVKVEISTFLEFKKVNYNLRLKYGLNIIFLIPHIKLSYYNLIVLLTF